jgi:hypothetical protein
MSRRKIRLLEDNAKCPHRRKFTFIGTLRQVFICLRFRNPHPLLRHCIRVYRILIHTGGGGGGGDFNQREKEEAQQFTKLGRKY